MEKNILIVDDTQMNRKLLKEVIEKSIENVKVLEAEDGFAALEILDENEINVVILDIMMPQKDGIEVLQDIKKKDRFKDIPVIMWSAINTIDSVEKALKLGALDYFTKPLSPNDMKVALPLKIMNAIDYYEQKLKLIEYNEHIKSEMELAQNLQKSLIVEEADFENVSIYGKYIPTEEIGGDFFSAKDVNGNTWFIIADVSGHGVASAMLSTMISVVYDMSIQTYNKPNIVLRQINKLLYKTFEGYRNSLASAVVGLIKENQVYISSAGHPPVIIYKKDEDEIDQISIDGFLLGVMEDANFDVIQYDLKKGDVLFLYTDGLFDNGLGIEFFKAENVTAYCHLNKTDINYDIKRYVDHMVDFFKNKGTKGFIDDVAVLSILKK
ncbi:MAG: SpoIIE family protein phosphatase [Marinisporobacter sp.]|nr:SpoIIE family protein phosphatase [Marinisporobacter sp.]